MKKFIPFWVSLVFLLGSVSCDDTPQIKVPSGPPPTLGERLHEALFYSLNGQQCETEKRAVLSANKADLIANVDLLFTHFPLKAPDSKLINERIKSLKNSKIDAVADQLASLINYRKDDLTDSLETLFPNAALAAPSEDQIWKGLHFLQRDELKTLAKINLSDAETEETLSILERMQTLAISEDGQSIAKAFLGNLAFSLPTEEQVWTALQAAQRPELLALARSLRTTMVEFARPTRNETKEMLAISKRLMALAQTDDSRFIQNALFGEFALSLPDEEQVWNALQFAQRDDVQALANSFKAGISEIRNPTKDDTKEMLAILGRIRGLATSDEARAIAQTILGDISGVKLDETQIWNAIQFAQRDDVKSLAKRFHAGILEVQNPTREDTKEIRAILERLPTLALSDDARAIADGFIGDNSSVKLDDEQIWNTLSFVQRDDVKALGNKLISGAAELLEPTQDETKEMLGILERFKVLALSEETSSIAKNLLADVPLKMPSDDQIWEAVQFTKRDDVNSLAKSFEVGVSELRNPTQDETREILAIFDRLKTRANSEKGQLVTAAILGDLDLATLNEEQIWNALKFAQREEVKTLANSLQSTASEFANPTQEKTREMLAILERLKPVAFSEETQFISETFFGDTFSQIPSEEYVWNALQFVQRGDVQKVIAALHAGSAEFAKPTRSDTKEVKQILRRFQTRVRSDDGFLIGENLIVNPDVTKIDEEQAWKVLLFVRREEVQTLLKKIRSGMLELSNPTQKESEEFLSILEGFETLANSEDGLFIRSGFIDIPLEMPTEDEASNAYNLRHLNETQEIVTIVKELHALADSDEGRFAQTQLMGASQIPDEAAFWNVTQLAKHIEFTSIANDPKTRAILRILRRMNSFMETADGKLLIAHVKKSITHPSTRTAMLKLAQVVDTQDKPSKDNEKWGISLLLGEGWKSYLAREACIAWLTWFWHGIEAQPIREAFDLGMMLYKAGIVDQALTLKDLSEELVVLHEADFALIRQIRDELNPSNSKTPGDDIETFLADPNRQRALLWVIEASFEKGGAQSVLRAEHLARAFVDQNSFELQPFKRILGDLFSFMVDEKHEDLTKKSYKLAFLSNDTDDLVHRLRTLSKGFFDEHQSDFELALALSEELGLIFATSHETEEQKVRRYASYLNNSQYKKAAKQIYDRLLTKDAAVDLLRLNELSFHFEAEHKNTIDLALSLAAEFGISPSTVSRERFGRFIWVANDAKHRNAAKILFDLTFKPDFVEDLLRLDALSQDLLRDHEGDIALIKKLAQDAGLPAGGPSRDQVAKVVSFANEEKRQAAAKVIFEVVKDERLVEDIVRLHQLSQNFLVVHQNDLTLIKNIAGEYKISISDITREQVGKFVSYANDTRHQEAAKAVFALASNQTLTNDALRLEELTKLFLTKNQSDIELVAKLAQELGLSMESISREQVGKLVAFVSDERKQKAAKALLSVTTQSELAHDLVRLQRLSQNFLADHQADIASIQSIANAFGVSFERVTRGDVGKLVGFVNDETHQKMAKTLFNVATKTGIVKDLVRLTQLSAHFWGEHQRHVDAIKTIANDFGFSAAPVSRENVGNLVAYVNDDEHRRAAQLLFAMMSKKDVLDDLSRLDSLGQQFLAEHQADIDNVNALARDFKISPEQVSRKDVHNVVTFVNEENNQQAAKKLFALVSKKEVVDDLLRLDELSRQIFAKHEHEFAILTQFAQELGLSLGQITRDDVHSVLSFMKDPRNQNAIETLFEIGVELQIFVAQAKAQLGSPSARTVGLQLPEGESPLVFALLENATKEDVHAFSNISKLAFNLWSLTSKNQCQPASSGVLQIKDLREGLTQMSHFLTTPEYGFKSWLSLLRRMASDMKS